MPCRFLCCVRPGAEDVRELDYSHCSLADVPGEVFVFERTLERLHCQSNRITELPRQLFICHELKVLNVSDNEILELPSAISALINLQLLDFSKNAITTLPESIKSLKQLHVLDLSVNPLEKLPEAITNLIFLQELFLNDVYLEYLPGNFGRLKNLKILELRDNYLMILPKSLNWSAELVRLDIGQNEFVDFPEVVGKFPKLQELWMDCNSLTAISPVIRGLTKLIHLEASNNMIADLPPEISECGELVELSLSNNHINQLPDTIGALRNLVSLKLDCNKLFSLPDSIGDMESLEELILTSNFIYDLPPTVGRLRKLQCLNLDENMLKVIPPEIGSCSALTVLSLRSNRLTFIPSEVGHLSALKVLNLVRNSLQCLPQTLLNCGNLVALWLSENQSKPLVPMQSEIDPRTCQQVLTCFLFPQVSISPTDNSANDRKSYASDLPATARHISFVDMKAAAKNAAEKPGQLRRAPTPYPKELRALAKHARNIQKDSADESLLSMQNAVHIKAAKITPTLQQRFASNHSISGIRNPTNDWYDSGTEGSQKRNLESSQDSQIVENPYDKPINLEQDKSYQNLDQTLYSESTDSAYGGFNEQVNARSNENPYSDSLTQALENNTIEDRVDGIIQQTSHDLYAPARRMEEKRISPLPVPSFETLSSGNRNSISSNVSQGSQLFSRQRENAQFERNTSDKMYGNMHMPQGINSNLRTNTIGHTNESIYSPGSPYMETYAQAKEKIYGRRREDIYGHYTTYQTNAIKADADPISDHAQLDNHPYNNSNNEKVYFSNHSTPDPAKFGDGGKVYNSNSPTVIYSHSNNANMNTDSTYETTSISSKQDIYGQTNVAPYYNPYSIYESMPNANLMSNASEHRTSPSACVQPSKINPPPYHIAATYSKQAQFFNSNR